MEITVKKIERAKMIKKKKITFKENMLLISINVVGSTGPIRFIVKADETVKDVINSTLSRYGQQRRLPMFSSHCTSSFLLYCPYSPAQPLNPCSKIGSTGSRNFVMCKDPQAEKNLEVSADTTGKISGKWRVWLNNSVGLMLPLLKPTSHVFGIRIKRFCVPV